MWPKWNDRWYHFTVTVLQMTAWNLTSWTNLYSTFSLVLWGWQWGFEFNRETEHHCHNSSNRWTFFLLRFSDYTLICLFIFFQLRDQLFSQGMFCFSGCYMRSGDKQLVAFSEAENIWALYSVFHFFNGLLKVMPLDQAKRQVYNLKIV